MRGGSGRVWATTRSIRSDGWLAVQTTTSSAAITSHGNQSQASPFQAYASNVS